MTWQPAVRAERTSSGVTIHLTHERAAKLGELLGELPADGVGTQIWDALNDLGYCS